MGQKVSPTGLRLGIVKGHASVWYAGKKDYADYLLTETWRFAAASASAWRRLR